MNNLSSIRLKLHKCIFYCLLVFTSSCAHFTKPTPWLAKLKINKAKRIYLSASLSDAHKPKTIFSNNFYLSYRFAEFLEARGFEVCSSYPNIGNPCSEAKENDLLLELRIIKNGSGIDMDGERVQVNYIESDINLWVFLKFVNGTEDKKQYEASSYYNYADPERLESSYTQAVEYILEDFKADFDFISKPSK